MNHARFLRLAPLLLALSLLLSACSSSTVLNGGSWQAAGLHDHSVRVLAVDQNHPTNLFAGDAQGRLFASSDAGLHWSERDAGLPLAAPIHALSMDGAGKKLYAGTERGLYVSLDAAQHWMPVAHSHDAQLLSDSVTALEFDPNAVNELYVATAHHSVIVSTDGGTSWSGTDSGLPPAAAINDLTFDPTTRLLWASTSAGIYRSATRGTSWLEANAGLPAGTIAYSVQSAAASGGAKGLLFAGTSQGFFRSQDGGVHWRRGQVPFVGTTVRDVLVDFRSTNATTLYLATDTGAFRSDDSGQNWNGIAAGLPRGAPVYMLALGAENFSQLYAVTGDIYLFPGMGGTIAPSRVVLILAVIVFFYLLFRFTHRKRQSGQRPASPPSSPSGRASASSSSTPER